ncbi:MAG: hypothetical protein KatS3mg019_2579 [Fimbriimonadales bacterium]|nr:MAG: hypothetical protein KatS3mg019_2579 [Fimbriimonadales bacterium]
MVRALALSWGVSCKGIILLMTRYYELKEPECCLYNVDVLQASLEPNSIDLIVTSPPYNVAVVYGVHRDDLSYAEYLQFCEAWLTRCYEWLKSDGRFCLNIPLDKNKGGQQSVGADLTTLAKRIGFHYHATIVSDTLRPFRWSCPNAASSSSAMWGMSF